MIELISVIVLAGILTVVASNLLSKSSFDERYLFEDVKTAARYAQKVAMGRGCSVRFSINGSSFSLMHDVNCANASAASYTGYVYKPFATTGGAVQDRYSLSDFPSGVTVSSATVDFFPQGWACTANGTDHSTVTITISGTVTRTLNIECGTGFVYES